MGVNSENNLSLLFIEPWITDFTAYNLWAEPLGLLTIASAFREAGARVHYLNCLWSSTRKNPKPRQNGCSKYIRTRIEKPSLLAFVPRYYARYGIDEEEFAAGLRVEGKPDAVLVTSHMTYWYQGVQRAVELVKSLLGDRTPVVLGGTYAKLCPDHARRTSGADVVYTGDLSPELFRLVEGLTGKRFRHVPASIEFPDYPFPMHQLHARAMPAGGRFFAILTLRGCPFACTYCASALLNPGISRRRVPSILTEIETYTHLLGTRNLALYDDALLIDAEEHAVPLLKALIEKNMGHSIHLPNGIHARFITAQIAGLLRSAGVKTVMLGLETCDEELQGKTGNKTSNREFQEAVHHLGEAGYDRGEIGAYILVGLPVQRAEDVDRSIDFAHLSGASPFLSHFSPIPGTSIWKEAVRSSPFPIEEEPLFHNKSVFILGNGEFSPGTLAHLKQKALELRKPP